MSHYTNIRAALIKKTIRAIGANRFFICLYKYLGGWLSNVRVRKQLSSSNFNSGISLLKFNNISYFLKTNPLDLIEATAMLKNVWEPDVVRTIDSMLENKRGLFIDIGANIGAITMPLAKRHPEIEFLCVEPNPQVLERLYFNIKINYLKNVKVVEKIFSSEVGKKVTFFAQEYKEDSVNMGESTLVSQRLGQSKELYLETTTLDFILNSTYKDRELLGIKMDVQGHEYEVLRGAEQTIARQKPFIVGEFEAFHYLNPKAESEKVKSFLKDNGYLAWGVNFELLNFKPEVNIGESFEGDFLAIHIESTNDKYKV